MTADRRTRDGAAGLAARLKQARLDWAGGLSLSQAELAAAVGVSQATISDYERGRRQPGLDGLVRLADHLGVAPGWLLAGRPAEPDADDDLLPDHRADLLSHRLAELLAVSSIRWLVPSVWDGVAVDGTSGTPAQAATAAATASLAAEEGADYGPQHDASSGRPLILDRLVAGHACAATTYQGPPRYGLLAGDVLLLGPFERLGPACLAIAELSPPDAPGEDAGRQRGGPGHRLVLVPPRTSPPPHSRMIGPVEAIFRHLT